MACCAIGTWGCLFGGGASAAGIPTRTEFFNVSAVGEETCRLGGSCITDTQRQSQSQLSTLTSLVPGPIAAGSETEKKKGGFRIPKPWWSLG